MCGIVAGVSYRNIVPILTEGLRRMEYRGVRLLRCRCRR